jgi:hypothetical protein
VVTQLLNQRHDVAGEHHRATPLHEPSQDRPEVAADTGSMASNGSSSTSSRGVCSSAVAKVIFLRIPAE